MSTINRELSTSVVINGKKYLILTEDLIPKSSLSIQGSLSTERLFRQEPQLQECIKITQTGKKIIERIQEQHQIIIRMLKKNRKRYSEPLENT